MHSSEKHDRGGIVPSTTRRTFLKMLSGAAVSSLFIGAECEKSGSSSPNPDPEPKPAAMGPRAGLANPFVTGDGRPKLVCVEGKDFRRMLQTGLDSIGGLSALIDDNQDVLIKPNLFEASLYPWISSMDSIVEIIKAAKRITSGDVSVGDMSWEATPTVYSHVGFENLVRNAGGIPRLFTDTYNVRRPSWDSSKKDVEVYADVYDAPVLISTCVLKRHSLAHMTCAVKCNVGTIKGSNMSASRKTMHDAPDFLSELAEVAGLSNPDLNIVDARSIVTEAGPSFQQSGTVIDANKVIICGDIVATDAYCSQLLADHDDGFDPDRIRLTLERAERLGLGTSDLSQVETTEIML